MSTPRTGKQGQAALEYLVTYGWGFLVILVVIGALAYFGFLSPDRYTPSRCSTGAQLECVDFQVVSAQTSGANEQVLLQFRNGFGDSINVSAVYFFNDTTSVTPSTADSSIKRGNTSSTMTFDIGTTNRLPKDDRVSIPIIVTFSRNQSGARPHNVTGEIFATVQ